MHRNDTIAWATDKEIGISYRYAQVIGDADAGVDDTTETGPMPIIGNQGYHFNRAKNGEEDTRAVLSRIHYNRALSKALDAKQRYDQDLIALAKYASRTGTSIYSSQFANEMSDIRSRYFTALECAFTELGKGLHPLQDIYAHGQIGVGKLYGDHMVFVGTDGLLIDNLNLRRADDKTYDWADPEKQSSLVKSDAEKRYNETYDATYDYLTKFLKDLENIGIDIKDVK